MEPFRLDLNSKRTDFKKTPPPPPLQDTTRSVVIQTAGSVFATLAPSSASQSPRMTNNVIQSPKGSPKSMNTAPLEFAEDSSGMSDEENSDFEDAQDPVSFHLSAPQNSPVQRPEPGQGDIDPIELVADPLSTEKFQQLKIDLAPLPPKKASLSSIDTTS